MEKYNEIQLTKNKMDFNNQKMKKSSTLSRIRSEYTSKIYTPW